VLFILQLELKLKLFIQVVLELIAILERIETIIEDSEDFVSPELYDLFLALIEVLICLVKSLEDLRDISHVEDVVALSWCRKEILLDDIEKVNRSQRHGLTEVLDLLIKDLEFEGCNCLEDFLHLGLSRDGIVYNVEL